MSSSTHVTTAVVSDDPKSYEDQYVHTVYEEIASHFSSTRYKPWPIIAQFLSNLPAGWVGLDSGTGNGKYLPLPLDRPGALWTIGLDRSRNLLEIAREAGGVVREVVWSDILGNEWRPGVFDYAISIATIHHLSTYARRKLAVQRLLECVSPMHGRVLIYVWAVEQDTHSKRTIPTAHDGAHSRSTHDTKGADVFVPWVSSRQSADASSRAKTRTRQSLGTDDSNKDSDAPIHEPKVFNRFYHMFAEAELVELACHAARDLQLHVGLRSEGDTALSNYSGVEIKQSGWERSNYYVELRRWQI